MRTQYQPADAAFIRLCQDIVLARKVDGTLARQFERQAFNHLAAYADVTAFTSCLKRWDDQLEN